MPVQRLAIAAGQCVSEGHGDAQCRIRSEVRLVRRAVQLDEYAVQRSLVQPGPADNRRRNALGHVENGRQHSRAAIARGVAVSHLQCLSLARAGAGRYRCAAPGTVRQDDVNFDRRPAARIDYLAGIDLANLARQRWDLMVRIIASAVAPSLQRRVLPLPTGGDR